MISSVPPGQQKRFDDLVAHFRERWEVEFSKPLQADHFDHGLPPPSDPLRLPVLFEVIAIDLVTRMDRGEFVSLSNYLDAHPEIGPASQLPVALLHVEYFHRSFSSRPISVEEYAAQYPEQAAHLLQLIGSDSRSEALATGTMVFETVLEPPVVQPIRDSSATDQFATGQSGYRLIRKLGEGNFGAVWLSEAPGGIEVALKVVPIPAGKTTGQTELQSLQVIKRVRHPFLLQVQAYWVSDEQLEIAMELADHSLRDRASENSDKTIPIAELIRYMDEAAEGLDFLHRENIVHRDIKPENILLLRGHIKVADFGLARFMDSSGLAVTVTQFAGTPLYMAPEVWHGKPVHASDQYSLAASYVELRTGTSPFLAGSIASVMREHVDGQPKLGELPEAEQAVLRKAMAKHPKDRYESCSQLVQALREATGVGKVLGQGSRWARTWFATSAIASLALAGLLVWWTIQPTIHPSQGLGLPRSTVVPFGETSSMVLSDQIKQVRVSGFPSDGSNHDEPRIDFEFDPARHTLDVRVDVNQLPGEQRVQLLAETSSAELAWELLVHVVESARVYLPNEKTRPSPNEPSRVVLDGKILYQRIETRTPNQNTIEWELIPKEFGSDPSKFYMMTTEVSNRWFAEFATANPDKISPGSKWTEGALAEDHYVGITEEKSDFPVVSVTYEEASEFARWLGGKLPTKEQWDKAAGWNPERTDQELASSDGPFRREAWEEGRWSGICIGRLEDGPAICGTSKNDISPFHVRDLAGSVREFTRDIFSELVGHRLEPFSPSELRLRADSVVRLRGNDYRNTVPWTFDERDSENLEYEKSLPDVGFRVVLELP